MYAAGSLYTILMLLAIVVSIVWIFLPFAIFGTKPRLDRHGEALADIARTLRRMEAIAAGNPLIACSSCGDRILATAERCPSCLMPVPKGAARKAREAAAAVPAAASPPAAGGPATCSQCAMPLAAGSRRCPMCNHLN